MALFDQTGLHMATVGVALGATLIRPCRRRWVHSKWVMTRQEIVYDSLSALAIVPFLVIVGSAFNTGLFSEAMKSNSDLMAVGGFWGLVSIVGDLLKVPPLNP